LGDKPTKVPRGDETAKVSGDVAICCWGVAKEPTIGEKGLN